MAVKKLSELTVAELKHELKKRNLDYTGEKVVLLSRLKKSLIEDANKAKLAQQQKSKEAGEEKKPAEETSVDQKKAENVVASTSVSEESTKACLANTATATEVKGPDFNTVCNRISLLEPSANVEASNSSKLNEDNEGNVVESIKQNESIASIPARADCKEELSMSQNDSNQRAIEEMESDSKQEPSDNEQKVEQSVMNESRDEVGDAPSEMELKSDGCHVEDMPKETRAEETVEVVKGTAEDGCVSMVGETNVSEKPGSGTVLVTAAMSAASPPINSETKILPGKSIGSQVNSLWVSGMVGVVKASDLKQAFNQYGRVVSAKIVTSAKSPGSRCFGLVTMFSHEDALKCIQGLNNKMLLGSTVTVELDVKHRVTRPQSQVAQRSQSEAIDESRRTSADTESIGAKDVCETMKIANSLLPAANESKEMFRQPPSEPVATKQSGAQVPASVNLKLPEGPQIVSNNKLETCKPSGGNIPSTKAGDVTVANAATTVCAPAVSIPAKSDVSTSVWLSGFPNTIKAAELKAFCLSAGKVLAAKVVANAKLQTYYGLVTMASLDDASACLKKINGTMYKNVYKIACEMSPSNCVTPELLKHFSKGRTEQQTRIPAPLQVKVVTTASKTPTSNPIISTPSKPAVANPTTTAKSNTSIATKPVITQKQQTEKNNDDKKEKEFVGKKQAPLIKTPPSANRGFRKPSPRGGTTSGRGGPVGGRYTGNNRSLTGLMDNNVMNGPQFGANGRGLLGDRRSVALMAEERRLSQEMAMINAQREKLQLETIRLERERDRMKQEQLAMQRRNEWKPLLPIKRPHEQDDICWRPPPHSAAKRFAPATPEFNSFAAGRRPPLLDERSARHFSRSAGGPLLGPGGPFPMNAGNFHGYW